MLKTKAQLARDKTTYQRRRREKEKQRQLEENKRKQEEEQGEQMDALWYAQKTIETKGHKLSESQLDDLEEVIFLLERARKLYWVSRFFPSLFHR